MDKRKIAEKIALELLDNDILDINNFGNETLKVLEVVQGIIIENLSDFLIISGQVIE